MGMINTFRIYAPYGIARFQIDAWYLFNREYLPLGYNIMQMERRDINKDLFDTNTGLLNKRKINEETLIQLAFNCGIVDRDKNDNIELITLFNDGTSPEHDSNCWPEYLKKIELIKKLGFRILTVKIDGHWI